MQVRPDGDQNRAVLAERVESGQILDIYFKVFPETGFTARMDERKKLKTSLRF